MSEFSNPINEHQVDQVYAEQIRERLQDPGQAFQILTNELVDAISTATVDGHDINTLDDIAYDWAERNGRVSDTLSDEEITEISEREIDAAKVRASFIMEEISRSTGRRFKYELSTNSEENDKLRDSFLTNAWLVRQNAHQHMSAIKREPGLSEEEKSEHIRELLDQESNRFLESLTEPM